VGGMALSFLLCLLSDCLFTRIAVYVDSAIPKNGHRPARAPKKLYRCANLSQVCDNMSLCYVTLWC
jgi:hypothetical protein